MKKILIESTENSFVFGLLIINEIDRKGCLKYYQTFLDGSILEYTEFVPYMTEIANKANDFCTENNYILWSY